MKKNFLPISFLNFSIFILIFLYTIFDYLKFKFNNGALNEILFHSKVPLTGTPPLELFPELFLLLKYLLIFSFIFFLILVILSIIYFKEKTARIYYNLSIIIFISSILFLFVKSNIYYNLKKYTSYSTIFDNNYINPKDIKIIFKENRNLILIFMESIETLSIAKEVSYIERKGKDDKIYTANLIPNLTNLALQNIHFTQNNKLSGAYSLPGTTWTTGGMVAITSGIPLIVPFFHNPYKNKFLNDATTIYDILNSNNYNQIFINGAYKEFGGIYDYFNRHKINTFYDLPIIFKEEKLSKDYKLVFGIDDRILINFTKNILANLPKNKPFSLTLETLNTHFPDGVLDNKCKLIYDDKYSNVLNCFDEMIFDFITWIQNQDFYKDTTIVLVGDHPLMNDSYYNKIPRSKRKVYFSIINPANNINYNFNKERDFSTFDIFPTILSSMGASIEGNKLGLGTNLFSSEKTLLEKYEDTEKLISELEKRSKLYEKLFY